MCDIDGVYRRLSTAKNAGKQLSTSFLRHWLLQTPGEENPKKRKKDAPSLAIGENYINKMFLFFNISLIFYLWMFLLIANRKESKKYSHRKGR